MLTRKTYPLILCAEHGTNLAGMSQKSHGQEKQERNQGILLKNLNTKVRKSGTLNVEDKA